MPRLHRRALALLAILAASLALAACGSSSPSSTSAPTGSTSTGQVHFAGTKFVLHAGLAFGAFHRYIYKPWRAGDFSHPFSHKLTLVKAGLAGAFVYHELKLALHDAQSSPTLSHLVAPITALQNRLHALSGHVSSSNAGQLGSDAGQVSQIEQGSAQAGQPIQEQTPPL
jgi:hypothetical protein